MLSKAITFFSRYLKVILSCSLFQLAFASPMQATHIVGGEIYYHYIGGNRYVITMIVYRDCWNGIPGFDDPAWVSIFYNNAAFTPKDTLRIPVRDSILIPPVINSPCLVPPINVCYKKATYVDTIILPPSPNGYWLVYQRCCRNKTIANIINPDQAGSTYTAFIPGTNIFSNNSNPVFNNLPPSFICLDAPFIFDNSAYDTDTNALGQKTDSLVYSLCNPLDYEGFFNNNPQPTPPFGPPYSNVTWQPPYNLNNLLGGGPMRIDPNTGVLTCTPNTIGQFVFGVCVDEYRNGIYLSTTKRDYQVNVVACPDLTVAALQTPLLNCDDLSVTFSNQSLNAATYYWDFGDPASSGNTSNLFSPTHIYSDTGQYKVLLVAYSGVMPACNDSVYGTVKVYPGYKIAFSYSKAYCEPIVTFNDSIFSGIYHTTGWNWNFGDGTSANITDPVHTYPGPGTYVAAFYGTSNKGCTDSMKLTIVLNNLQANINNSIPVSCFGDCNGSALVSTINGIPPFTYHWDDPLQQTTPAATGLCKGSYKVIVTDSAGCIDTTQISIIEPNPLKLVIKPFTDYCDHACVGSAHAFLTGGNGGYMYQWNDMQQQTSTTAIHLCDGLYTVTVTDSKGCTVSDTVTVNYTDSFPSVDATTDDDTLYFGQQTYIHATHSNGYIYSWTPSSSLSSASVPDPLSTPLETTNYLLQVTDSNGCKVSDTVTIWVLGVICREPEIFVPNAFTPNNDNINDVLLVRGNTLKALYFAVYDRWGEKVFETTDQKNGWDGTYKGEKSPPGVFDFYIKAVCYNKSTFIHKGNITLIR